MTTFFTTYSASCFNGCFVCLFFWQYSIFLLPGIILFSITGYIESFITTKDICVFTSTASEADNIGEILKANCYFVLVAHEFLEPQELASVKRQWNTPHSTDAMPVLGI